jgi:hypothetical protein
VKFKPGNKANPKGRPKGAKSKISESFWRDWLEVYNKLGNSGLLEEFALSSKHNMAIFLNWGAKTIPTNVQANISGQVDGNQKLVIEIVQTK